MTKPKTSAPPSAGGNAAPAEQPTFRSNPEVDAKIDAYIKENPKYWAYVQAMPRERLERSVVLNEVRELDRQQRMREGVDEAESTRNPELKTRLRYAGERPAGGPEGGRHRPDRAAPRAVRLPACKASSNTKSGRRRCLKPLPPLAISSTRHGSLSSGGLPLLFCMSPCRAAGNGSNGQFTEGIHLLPTTHIM